MSNNEKLMDCILTHLKKLIILTENGDEEQLEKLVQMACEVSNQLIRIENREYIDRSSYDDDFDENTDTEDSNNEDDDEDSEYEE